MKTFKSKWNHKSVEDAGPYMSRSGRSFCVCFHNMLKRTLKPYGITIAEFSINHYFCSAFLEKNGKYVYLTYSIPRGGMSIDFSESDALNGVLYRTASSLRDYTGGPNRFSSIEDLPTAIIDLFDWMERMGVS